MKQKIVITGGLGYIGTELCKLYSGEARYKNIIVVDSRFVSERVKQLRDWGIQFIQASILDEEVLKNILSDADIVIHLAGITDVAYVKTESDPQKDELIKKIGIDGTRNVIKYSSPTSKIIFPSTHVVYEGFDSTKLDISEEEIPKPVLTYSCGKVQSEKDLKESNKNYVILRLGSVYGYSTDTMRINIMPNLFAKIASQNGTIKLFSGGVQVKSLVPLLDVARCFKFMAEREDINREIFHLSKETMTVKDVALICKQYKPTLNIVETQDEIPNLGYTISNKKLLETGFTFRYSMRESIKEMIENWSEKKLNTDLEYLDKGGKEFIDSRGRILNYELTEPINLIGYIESKKATVRANHYHPIQEQKCLLIKGQYISVIKDLSVPDAPIETRVVNEGDIAIIKPNVAHAMVFTEDSIFLNLVRGEREHENYGVTHTIPYLLVDEKLKELLLKTYKLECRSCGSKHLDRVISLGMSPLANNLKNSKEEESELFPLEVNYCSKCHNCQLSVVVPPEKMFDHYLYVSSTAASFRKHFEDAAKQFAKEFNLNSNSLVIDIGSNDGVFLKPVKELGIKVLGVEPAKNIAKLATENGIPTVNSYFDTDTAKQILKEYGKAKLITASNVFAHSDELVNIAKNVSMILDEDGCFIIEVQYLKDTLKDLTFDNIYHEHVNYWSVLSLYNFFNKLNLYVSKVEHINTHGGSIRVYVKKHSNDIDASVNRFLNDEIYFGLDKLSVYKKFASSVEKIKTNVRKNILKLSKEKSLIGYGSPAKATTSLNYFEITDKEIPTTVDDNKLKNGKFIPGVNIKIVNKEHIMNTLPNTIIVFAWNFYEQIKKANEDLIKKGVSFINIKDLEKETTV
jgi:nucleoside-diphosphate-sugar epimerase